MADAEQQGSLAEAFAAAASGNKSRTQQPLGECGRSTAARPRSLCSALQTPHIKADSAAVPWAAPLARPSNCPTRMSDKHAALRGAARASHMQIGVSLRPQAPGQMLLRTAAGRRMRWAAQSRRSSWTGSARRAGRRRQPPSGELQQQSAAGGIASRSRCPQLWSDAPADHSGRQVGGAIPVWVAQTVTTTLTRC